MKKSIIVICIMVVLGCFLIDDSKCLHQKEINQIDLKQCQKLMIVAHPDDETIWGGSHLLKGHYLVVCLTNGNNEKRKRKRGASTISQQTAKNVFLWPQSSWVRKGLEVYFTFLIETFWSKERIMTLYLNSIEMGKGIYGAQATAKYKFNTTALIAATLPNPIRFDSAHPSSYILKRQKQILRLMNLVPKFPPVEKEKKVSKPQKKKKR